MIPHIQNVAILVLFLHFCCGLDLEDDRASKNQNPYNLQCFGGKPLLVKSNNPKFGDLCRNDNYPKNTNWRCPKDCVKTKNNKKPFCTNKKKCKKCKNKKKCKKCNNACRVSKDISALPPDCRDEIQWDYEKGRKKDAAKEWFGDMKELIGVGYNDANIYDFVRFYKCAKRKPHKCSGIFWPKKCSKPPCNKCLAEAPARKDCAWGPWNEGECSATCGGGTRTDSREMSSKARNGGYCNFNGGTRTVPCNTHACPPIHCAWGDWTLGECSVTCGIGTRVDTRVKTIMESNGGKCDGCDIKIESCINVEECPEPEECKPLIHCVWAEWNVGSCSHDCGGGVLTKRRARKQDAQNGGDECQGEQSITESCNDFECPVNCSWSEWEEETCDCDSETKRKTRVQFKEMFGGKPCEGESELVEPCDEEELETLCKEQESCPETCMCQTPPRGWPGRRSVQGSGVAKGYCFHYCDPEGYCGVGQEAKAQGQSCTACRMKFYGY